jgi:hypothetical protein
MTNIIQDHIDRAYDAVETLNVCSELLANGASDKTIGSVSWLLGSTAKTVSDMLTMMEQIKRAQAMENGDRQ